MIGNGILKHELLIFLLPDLTLCVNMKYTNLLQYANELFVNDYQTNGFDCKYGLDNFFAYYVSFMIDEPF